MIQRERLITAGQEKFLPSSLSAAELLEIADAVYNNSHAPPPNYSMFLEKVEKLSGGNQQKQISLERLYRDKKDSPYVCVFNTEDSAFAIIMESEKGLGYKMFIRGYDPSDIADVCVNLRILGYPAEE